MEVARHWRLKQQRYNLEGVGITRKETVAVGVNGNGNGTVHYHIEQPAESVTVTGTVYSYSVVMSGAAGFAEQAPYVMAMVELEDGTLVTAQLTDLDEEPTIGLPVEMVTRRLRTDGDNGMIVYGYKFRPIIGM